MMIAIFRTWLLIALCGGMGCGRSLEIKTEAGPSNLSKLHALYVSYMQMHRAAGPVNLEEFKRFISNEGSTEARRLDVDLTNLDQLFLSPRDNEPYIINYGLHFDAKSIGRQVFIYESRGRDGRRAVAYATGWSEEVDPQKAAELGLKEI
jgi:hypothetical protein